MNFNKVFIAGRLTKDIDVKATPSGKSVCSFSVAVNDYKNENANFFSVVAWDKTAEFIGKYFGKGDSLFIEGRLQTRDYTNSKGVTIKVTEIVADKVEFTESKSEKKEYSAPSIDVKADEPTAAPTWEDIMTDNEELPF